MTHHETQPSPIPCGDTPGRRTFLGRVTAALSAVAAAIAGIPCVGYFLGSHKPAAQWVRLAPLKDFQVGETRLMTFDNPLRQPWDGMTAETNVYVRYQGNDLPEQEQFLVFAVNCAHLGCPVSWFPQSGLFMCPCHGGVYYANGERASGPPPRGLFHCQWRVKEDHLEVQSPHYPTLQDTLEKKA